MLELDVPPGVGRAKRAAASQHYNRAEIVAGSDGEGGGRVAGRGITNNQIARVFHPNAVIVVGAIVAFDPGIRVGADECIRQMNARAYACGAIAVAVVVDHPAIADDRNAITAVDRRSAIIDRTAAARGNTIIAIVGDRA